MCLIAIAWQQHPDYPLIVIANRDEFFDRPAAPAHWWPDPAGLLAGRDLRGGGTWLGVGRNGRFAALTNYRDPKQNRADARSRGDLVVRVATNDQSAAAFGAQVIAEREDYNPFNLLVSDGDALVAVESVTGQSHTLPPGVHTLSNHLLDTPWPKALAARRGLEAAIRSEPDIDALINILRDDRPAPDAALPDTGVPLAWERMLSSCFIRAPGYGTRCTTIVMRSNHGQMRFVEARWHTDGAPDGRTDEQFDIA
ncbi:NRDE family protein [Denitromonas ohlonensis]|uniref:NRDE family protein n=2 Tax=Denitromonas TaxID=139331 RepID=A0A557REN3_9RHOO|nr:NRDE family protein [Denitromonas ohlonensis]TVO63630.1 NRDE family protein [Denitromonas ohlonensis]TVO74164.1 NRDE family protein [Denitromonas ohlonensis]